MANPGCPLAPSCVRRCCLCSELDAQLTESYSAGAVTTLAWSPDGHFLAAASLDAPGFVVFDISLGTSTPLQAGAHALLVACMWCISHVRVSPALTCAHSMHWAITLHVKQEKEYAYMQASAWSLC